MTINNGGGKNTNYNLNYRKEFDKSNHYFEIDANFSISPFNSDVDQKTTGDRIEGTRIEDLKSDNNILTMSADYYNSNDHRTWEFGLRGDLISEI